MTRAAGALEMDSAVPRGRLQSGPAAGIGKAEHYQGWQMSNGSKKALQLAWSVGGPAPWLVTMVIGRDEQEGRSC